MGLIDELRSEVDKQKDREQKEKERHAAAIAFYEAEIQPRMQAAERYLGELTAHLNYLNADIVVSDYLAYHEELDGLRQQDYKLKTSTSDSGQRVSLFFMCQGEGDFCYQVEGKLKIEHEVDRLYSKSLHYECNRSLRSDDPIPRATFIIKREVPVRFTFDADAMRPSIDLVILNFEEIGLKRYRLRPEQLTEELLEEMGKMILRKGHAFLRHEIPDEHREQIRARLLEEQQQREQELVEIEAREAAEAATRQPGPGVLGRVRGLFSKDKS